MAARPESGNVRHQELPKVGTPGVRSRDAHAFRCLRSFFPEPDCYPLRWLEPGARGRKYCPLVDDNHLGRLRKDRPVNATRTSKTIRGAIVYFALVFGTGFLLGSVRVPFIVPRIGERYAELAEMPFMLMAIFFAARHVLQKYGQKTNPANLIGVGVIALLLLVGAELLLAVLLAGRGVGEYIGSRDKISGSVYLAMLLVFAGMPWLQAWKQNHAPHADGGA